MAKKKREKTALENWLNEHVIITVIVLPIITGIIASFIVIGYQNYTSPKPIIQITHLEWVTNITDAKQIYPDNITAATQYAGTRYIEIHFENVGQENCGYLNFTVQTVNRTALYWSTGVPSNATHSISPPIVRVSNPYGGAITNGETVFSVIVQDIEPYEMGWVAFKVQNYTFANSPAFSMNEPYITISHVSLCQNANYTITNRSIPNG